VRSFSRIPALRPLNIWNADGINQVDRGLSEVFNNKSVNGVNLADVSRFGSY